LTQRAHSVIGLLSVCRYDTRIFSLATLLCSSLIYNSLGSVDEAAISNLSFIANLTKHIRLKVAESGSGGGGGAGGEGEADESQEFKNFFPSFTWVVRDFALDLVDAAGDEITASDYLERALMSQRGLDRETMERNRVRQMLQVRRAGRGGAGRGGAGRGGAGRGGGWVESAG
jgi:hypothetical protein